MSKTHIKRSYLVSVLGCFCPRCREGVLFKNTISLGLKRNMEMHATCTRCQQPTDIEVGFYYGTGYVSYLICFFLSILSFLVWWLLIGVSFKDDRFTYWIICNSVFLLVMQPWLMRFSRSLWISWFVRYDVHWNDSKPSHTERVNASQMNNW
jgi:hypothetical protein